MSSRGTLQNINSNLVTTAILLPPLYTQFISILVHMYKGICTYIRTYVPVCIVCIFVHIENILVHAHTTHTHTYTSMLYMHCSAGGLGDMHTLHSLSLAPPGLPCRTSQGGRWLLPETTSTHFSPRWTFSDILLIALKPTVGEKQAVGDKEQ